MKPRTTVAGAPAERHTLGFLLRGLYADLQRQVYAEVEAAGHEGVRELHSPVLRHLPRGGGRVVDIARATGLAKQSVAYIVDDLVAQGYLAVEPDPDDGRARRVVYTRRGRQLLQALLAASRKVEARCARLLGTARMAAVRSALEVLHERVSTTPGAAGPPVH
jgi:DNA-binding MarR family transcriptional regulator